MKKFLMVAFAVVLGVMATAVANDDDGFSEVEYYRKLAEKQLAEAQAKINQPPLPELGESAYQYHGCVDCADALAPANVIVAVPQYFHSRNDKATFDMDGQKLHMGKGRANGMGMTLLYNRRINDVFTLGVTYEYAFLNVTGGMAMPVAATDRAEEDTRWHSHVVGLLGDVNLGRFGKMNLSLIQGFDRASGTETVYGANGTDSRDVDEYGTDVTSLMAWYEKDFDLGCGFRLTPYAGWRSLWVQVQGQNDWGGNPGDLLDSSMWVHLATGGLKASYQKGAFGFNLRGGINHRVSSDDVPGYGNRALAPGVVQFSHRANLDRTVGSFGAGVNFAIKQRAMVGVSYDGFYGKDTSAHTASLSFALPF